MMIRVYQAYDITTADLEPLLTTGEWRWLYGEGEADITLCWATEGVDDWSRWRHGRVFSAQQELAWWQTADGHYTLRLLQAVDSTPPPPISWEGGEVWNTLSDAVEQTLLHGELDEDMGNPDSDAESWSEARIPRWLHYPVDGRPTRVALTCQRYGQQITLGKKTIVDTRTVLTRLIAVEAARLGETTYG